MKPSNSLWSLLLGISLPVYAQVWEQRHVSPSPPSRGWHSMAYDHARGVTVLFGGIGMGGNHLGDTWEWNGTAWRQVIALDTGVALSAMAYYAPSGGIVRFGGRSATRHGNETYVWDATSWRQLYPPGPLPAPRRAHALAYDPVRGKLVLGGGTDSRGEPLLDTWEWDGARWKQIGAGPPVCCSYGLTYDGNLGETLLFGGLVGPVTNTMSSWNGSAWRDHSPSTRPPARSDHALVYDSCRRVAVLFGGTDGVSGYFGDTWEYNASNWIQSQSSSPPARDAHEMVYDPRRRATFLFGGQNNGKYFSDTWEYAENCSRLCTGVASAGPGHPIIGLSVSCLAPARVMGPPLIVYFAHSQATAFNVLLLGAGPCLSPPVLLNGLPGVCATALVYPIPLVVYGQGPGPATYFIPVPPEPILIGQVFCIQGAAFEVSGLCYYATEGLSVTIQP